MSDHRQEYSPFKLYINGSRMVDDYDVEDAVVDYVTMHPQANAAEIRAEIERELAKLPVS